MLGSGWLNFRPFPSIRLNTSHRALEVRHNACALQRNPPKKCLTVYPETCLPLQSIYPYLPHLHACDSFYPPYLSIYPILPAPIPYSLPTPPHVLYLFFALPAFLFSCTCPNVFSLLFCPLHSCLPACLFLLVLTFVSVSFDPSS